MHEPRRSLHESHRNAGFVRAFGRCFATLILSPTRSPACALAWWISGGCVFSLFMDAGLNPQSQSAAFMHWSESQGPLVAIATAIIYATLALGLIGGPWCLLYHFLTGKLFGGKRAESYDSK